MNFLEQAASAGATDLHLTEGEEAAMRLLGRMVFLGPCTQDDYQQTETLLRANTSILMKPNAKVKDFSATVPKVGRVRCRVYRARGKRSMAIRFLPAEIYSPEALGWPSAMMGFCSLKQGLVLITGATGSGKTTTLATLIDAINASRPCHIVTLESPVEVEFHAKQAMIHQCEIPEDVSSFAEGAKAVLRLDPDVIMVGELVDRETMRAVLKLAESGHLVLATMHTASAVDAIEYFINHFEASEQQVIRYQLANVLQGVVAQRLLTHREEERLVAAYEVLLRNTAVVQQIKNNDLAQLPNTIEAGRGEGMCLLEDHLTALVKSGAIRLEDAFRSANEPQRMKNLMSY